MCVCEIWASSQPTVGLTVSCGLTAEAKTDMVSATSGLNNGLNLSIGAVSVTSSARGIISVYERVPIHKNCSHDLLV